MVNDYRLGLEFSSDDFGEQRLRVIEFVDKNNLDCWMRWFMMRRKIPEHQDPNYWITTEAVFVVVAEFQSKNHRLWFSIAWSDFLCELPDNWRTRHLLPIREPR